VTWTLEIAPSAKREIRQLAGAVRLDARNLLRGLRETPLELADSVLRGHSDLYAARFYRGRYRMVYQVSRKQHRVIVLRARLRETAYEGLEPHWFG
jgi:mRNA-degrading endonuclease RelE of RelBE toxin-antitoxin system